MNDRADDPKRVIYVNLSASPAASSEERRWVSSQLSNIDILLRE